MSEVDWTPTRKITTVMVSGALTIVMTWGFQEIFSVDVPVHVGQAFSVLFAAALGYWIKD